MVVEASYSSQEYYFEILAKAEEMAKRSEVDHRWAGGVVANLFGPNTEVVVKAQEKVAQIVKPKKQSLIRADGTVSDFDGFGLSPDELSYKVLAIYLDTYKLNLRENQEPAAPFPPISMEKTFYSGWRNYRRSPWRQFVSTFDVNPQGELTINFGYKIKFTTSWETVAAWKYQIENGPEITSLNPYCLYLRYRMRNAAGLKKKDIVKITQLEKVSDLVFKQGLSQGVDYHSLYQTWEDFTSNMLTRPDLLTLLKAQTTKFYWDRMGTAMAHGSGLFAPLANWGNKFTG